MQLWNYKIVYNKVHNSNYCLILYNTGECPFLRPPSRILHPTCSAYIPVNNRQILMFKVSKWPYQSCRNDEIIICRWRHNLPGGKIWTKQPWVKIEYSRNFDRNFALFRGKIWLWLFYNLFCIMVPRFYTKKISSHFRIFISLLIGKINVTPSFLLKMTWNFLCRILQP